MQEIKPNCWAVLVRSKTMPHMIGKDFEVLMHMHKNVWLLRRNGELFKCGESRLIRIDPIQEIKAEALEA